MRLEEVAVLIYKLNPGELSLHKLQEWNYICILLPGMLSHCGNRGGLLIPWLTKPAAAMRVDWSDKDALWLGNVRVPWLS